MEAIVLLLCRCQLLLRVKKPAQSVQRSRFAEDDDALE